MDGELLEQLIDLERCWSTLHTDGDHWEYRPYSLHKFIRLMEIARLTEPHSQTFLEVGSGIGSKLVTVNKIWPNLTAQGIERVPSYLAQAERLLEEHQGTATLTLADAATFTGYDAFDIIYLNCPFHNHDAEADLEQRVFKEMKPGAIMLLANGHTTPGPAWTLIASELMAILVQKPETGDQ